MSNGKLKQAWADMKQRCNNKNVKSYQYYGARGITYCEAWEKYRNFEKWALENGFEKNKSLDRIDVNGNYEPTNCRWATRKQQDNNRTNNVFVVVQGEKMTLKQVSEKFGFTYSAIQHRYSVGDRGDKLIEPLNRGVRRDGLKRKKKALLYGYKNTAEAKWLSLYSRMTQKEIAGIYSMSQGFVSQLKRGATQSEIKETKPEWYK